MKLIRDMDDKPAGVQPRKRRKPIGIIGTGNYGRALAKRLVFSGYDVIIGSRRPQFRQLSTYDKCLCDVELTDIVDCVKRCDVLFVAIHAENFKVTLESISDEFDGKTVIDVSNRDSCLSRTSNTEYLSSLIKDAKVVKAFNVISSFVMENDIAGGSRRVFVAGDDPTARDDVCNLARDMGFAPIVIGGAASAQKIEAFVLQRFPGWKCPIFITFGIFNLWLLYVVYIYFIDKTAYRWDQIFVKVLNKPLCMTAITVMALVYMPGCLSAFLQLVNGTKHKHFPKWMDSWLRYRKQFGVICFVLVSTHVIMSVLLMSPTYYSSWFQSPAIHIPRNTSEDLHLPMKVWMTWKGEAACLVGIVAYVMLCVTAITTLPSVADTLNWREWRLLQSKLGHVILVLSVTHVIVMGAPGWIKENSAKIIQSITFLSIILPTIVLLMKFILLLPYVSSYVRKIRRGWERNPNPVVSGNRKGEEYVVLHCDDRPKARCGGNARCGCGQSTRRAPVSRVIPTPCCGCSVV
ncbi:metalloreductase STEAP4-like isoform X2 [Gigantopelta aegis]|uniref:metalloreductase STEAP4-like isoform X2 n=1 Tax=Gigantopelta aegis TaxID=1735272 RepID=UPI001B88E737|nr:metalloreductase STEAP4-like isoform X2 [Gigantopelta aegis]